MKLFGSLWKKPHRNSDSSTRDTRSSAGSDPVINTPSFLAAQSYDPPERSPHQSHHSPHDGGTSHHSSGHDHGGGSSSYDSGSSGGSDGGGGGGGD